MQKYKQMMIKLFIAKWDIFAYCASISIQASLKAKFKFSVTHYSSTSSRELESAKRLRFCSRKQNFQPWICVLTPAGKKSVKALAVFLDFKIKRIEEDRNSIFYFFLSSTCSRLLYLKKTYHARHFRNILSRQEMLLLLWMPLTNE